MKKFISSILSKILTVALITLGLLVTVLLFKLVNNQELSIFGYKMYYVLTESMEPTISADSLILVKETETNNIKEGDIISFISRDPSIRGMVNTHRVVGITQDNTGSKCYITKGDNNNVSDRYYVYPEDIKGKVVLNTFSIDGLSNLFQFATTRNGFLICVVLPIFLVALLYMSSFIKELKSLVKSQDIAVKLLENQLDAAEEGNIQTMMNSINELTPEQAKLVLELYTGKKYDKITMEDIEKACNIDGGHKDNEGIEENNRDKQSEQTE